MTTTGLDVIAGALDRYMDAVRFTYDRHGRDWPADDATLTAVEGLRATLRLGIAGFLTMMESDPAFPVLAKVQSQSRQYQLPSPDAVYHGCRLHGDYIYRIRGHRGSAHIFHLGVFQGSTSNLRDWATISMEDNFGNPRLSVGCDVDIILSAKPQEGYWLKLPDGPCEFMLRQYYNDWDNEQPARLTIERVGAQYPPPTTSEQTIVERLALICDFLHTQTKYYRSAVQRHLDSNAGALEVQSIPGAFAGATYLTGHYRCKPREAVILEMRPPVCKYWTFQLLNLQWEAMDYHLRQTSLNGHQAHLDSNGVFRAVIAHEDPGIANWLDPGGHTLGLIAGRYYRTETSSPVTLRTVPFESLREHIPVETIRVSREERHQTLQRRLLSCYRRGALDT